MTKVDDYPLYHMRYYGDYGYPATGWRWPLEGSYACSLFAALGESEEMLFGRNFDWEFSPALVLITDPVDGYASISMVDLIYLGIEPTLANSLTGLPLADRVSLLAAPSLPFDGMNEYGLTIGMAAVPESLPADGSRPPSRPTIGSIGVIRQALDHARNVDEAVAVFARYTIDFSGGPPIHYLIADPSGKAVLLEYCRGELNILANEGPWHLATNHLRCSAEGDGGCPRYRTMAEQLTATNGRLDASGSLQLLSQVAQRNTQWSVVYHMSSGDVDVVVGGAYETVHTFQLKLVNR